MARFPARSAFSSTGLTTQDIEQLVNHPVRRKIILILIILQEAGIITAGTALILDFVNTGTPHAIRRGGILTAGLIILYLASRSKTIERFLSHAVEWVLGKHTRIDFKDYYTLFNLERNLEVTKITIE